MLRKGQIDNNMIMQQTIEQYQTVQNYVATLFDSLPRIQLSSQNNQTISSFSDNQSIQLIKKLITQNKFYGKKIIELSQKFTSIYRKDHIYDKKNVQENIKHIYQIVVANQRLGVEVNIDQMLTEILTELRSKNYRQLVQQSLLSKHFLVENTMMNQLLQQKMDQRNIMKSDRNMMMMGSNKSSMMGNNKSSMMMSHQSRATPNQNLFLHNLNPNGDNNMIESIGVSRKQSITNGKSKLSTKSTKKREKNILQQEQIPIKKILKIKSFMQQQQTIIKQLIQKAASKIQQLKISKLNLSNQKLVYTKIEDETNRDSLESLLQASTTNHKSNLNSLGLLMEMIFADFDRKVSREMLSENRFAVYTREIEKRQEVYSYAVSKLIGHINNLKTSLTQQRYRESLQIAQDLISIGTKFYELYPSNSIIKDLKVSSSLASSQRKQIQITGQSNYGVQVNTMKGKDNNNNNNKSSLFSNAQSSNRQFQLQMFKFETKLNEVLQKFEKNQMKFKKSLQVKQVIRLMNTIRQLVPDRNKSIVSHSSNNINNNNNSNTNKQQMLRFQQQYKQLMRQSQMKQQKLREQHTKKEKKYQKTIRQLQQSIQLCQQQRQKLLTNSKQQLRKVNKKYQTLQQKYTKSQRTKQQLQQTIKNVSEQIQKIKKKYREQQLKYEHKYHQLQQKLSIISQQNNNKSSKLSKLSSIQSQKQVQFQREIQLYKKKILILEENKSRLQMDRQQLMMDCQKLQSVNKESKQRLEEMTNLYNEKMTQLQTMIQTIDSMKLQLQVKHEQIIKLQQQLSKLTINKEQLKIQLQQQQQKVSELTLQLQQQKREKQKTLQMGQLNESDITLLKQQMQKVHSAYVQSEDQLQSLRLLYEQLQTQYNKLQQHLTQIQQKNTLLNKQLEKITIIETKQLKLRQQLQQKLRQQLQQLTQQLTNVQTRNEQLVNKQQQLQVLIYHYTKNRTNCICQRSRTNNTTSSSNLYRTN